jgi:ERF superfamily
MQRSSESIASLAAALAKAQTELVNPEKSLVATISPKGSDGAERTFRYASLASGLDIVRKILGQHEIAIVQTSAVDHTAGVVNLTTVLAHASGEWIASEWPVCAISETTTPHRMGAALTYARRYGLFTLVGIAGEDDLDAPDLAAPTSPKVHSDKPSPGADRKPRAGLSNARRKSRSLARKPFANDAQSALRPEVSAASRDHLLAELTNIASDDQAALWAHRHLPDKNKLTATDAVVVEQAFQERLMTFSNSITGLGDQHAPADPLPVRSDSYGSDKKNGQTPKGIDKSALSIPEPRRARDRAHTRFVATQPCLICGRFPADAHHLRFAQRRALGRKVSDEHTVPLCRGHHREAHRCGDEAAWWKRSGIDPMTAARTLWLEAHPLLSEKQDSAPTVQDE